MSKTDQAYPVSTGPYTNSDISIRRYKEFKEFNKRICVATDVFGRGIDIERINLAINYDLPADADSYLHRVGRAGRFGTKGLAISFVTTDQDKEVLKSIEKRFEVALPYVIPITRWENCLLTLYLVSSRRRVSMPRRTWHRKRVWLLWTRCLCVSWLLRLSLRAGVRRFREACGEKVFNRHVELQPWGSSLYHGLFWSGCWKGSGLLAKGVGGWFWVPARFLVGPDCVSTECEGYLTTHHSVDATRCLG